MNSNKERLSVERRKEIYEYRKRRRAAQEKGEIYNPYEIRAGNKILTLREDVFPSLYEFFQMLEKAADSAWFALEELERFYDHCNKEHISKGEKGCNSEGCLEDFTMEDAKDFTQTILDNLEGHLKEEKNEQ